MTASSNAMPSVRGNRDGITRVAERVIVRALIATGAVLIIVPLVLTLYLSLFDEKLILFPPRGYTLDWYPAIVPNFGRAVLTSLKLGALAVAGSLALGIPAGIGLARHRFRGRGAIATLLLAPLTVPGIALGLAIYVALVAIDEQLGSAVTGSMIGLVLAHIMITTPWVVRLCLASLTNHDRAAEEAAASLGPARSPSSGASPCRRCVAASSRRRCSRSSSRSRTWNSRCSSPAPASPRCRSRCCNTWSTTSTR
jgi:ABC-type spermidine/putrescine transport system permease subunit II